MTSTRFNVGLGESHKNSSRVLKPPGGGTSDIFGAAEPPVQNSERHDTAAAHNSLQSSMFGPQVTPHNKPGNDSSNRLFGPGDSRPHSASKNLLKSNIFFSNDDSTSPTNDNNANSVSKDFSTSAVDGLSTKDGNVVTCEGYANEEKQPAANNLAPPAAQQPTTNGMSHSASSLHTRVPPGGFSSGLW